MSVLTIREVRSSAERARAAPVALRKSAFEVLKDVTKAQATAQPYDIFLSHASADADIVLGISAILKGLGHSVYIDWLEDPHLDRSHVTPATAAVLRDRMNQCRSLFFATTEGSSASRWMPWECGYFDGSKGKSAILPVLAQPTEHFVGQEYLGLYPYITKNERQRDGKVGLWVRRSVDIWVEFEAWLRGEEPRRH